MKLYLVQKNENKNTLKSILKYLIMKKFTLANFVINVLQYGRHVFWRKNIQKKAFMCKTYSCESETSCEDIWLPNRKKIG